MLFIYCTNSFNYSKNVSDKPSHLEDKWGRRSRRYPITGKKNEAEHIPPETKDFYDTPDRSCTTGRETGGSV